MRNRNEERGCGSCCHAFQPNNTGVTCCDVWQDDDNPEPVCSEVDIVHGCEHWKN